MTDCYVSLHFLLYFLLYLVTERYNKKCKNYTANNNNPIASLANSLVRDGTARYFRWRRAARTTRTDKIPITELTSKGKLTELSDSVRDSVQTSIQCGCRVDHCIVHEHKLGKIGGKHFTSGERLRVGRRCGSVVTMVSGGISVYGLVKKFYRIHCECSSFVDVVLVTWFPNPHYPDRDPLTVEIEVRGLDVNNMTQMCVVPLYDIQPSRIAVEMNTEENKIYMLRYDGIDENPLFN